MKFISSDHGAGNERERERERDEVYQQSGVVRFAATASRNEKKLLRFDRSIYVLLFLLTSF